MSEIRAILPSPTSVSKPFWEACNEARLMLQRCRATGTVFYYPRLACPATGGRDLEWIEASGNGWVWTYSHVHVPFCGAEWEDQLPYTVILVDLDEGPRMLSRLIGEDRAAVRVGARVHVRFVVCERQALPFFVLSNDRG